MLYMALQPTFNIEENVCKNVIINLELFFPDTWVRNEHRETVIDELNHYAETSILSSIKVIKNGSDKVNIHVGNATRNCKLSAYGIL